MTGVALIGGARGYLKNFVVQKILLSTLLLSILYISVPFSNMIGLVILLFLMGLLYGVNLTLVTTSLPAKVESKQYRNQAKLSNNCSNDWHGCIYDVDRRSCRPRNGKPLNRRNYGLGRSCGVCVRNGFGTATRNLADVVARVSDRRVTKGPGRTVDTYRMVGVVPYSRETLHPIFPATFHGSALCARPQVREESAGTSAVSTSGTWR